MGIFSKQKSKEEIILVLDIGSSSVGGALFSANNIGKPKIMYAVREDLQITPDLDFSRFQILTMSALDRVVESVYRKGLATPDRIFCTLSSSWYVSQTRTIHLEKNVPFEFTNKLADSLLEKEIALFKEEYMESHGDMSNIWRPIEMKNIKISLNGYDVENPVGQSAKDLEMIIFIALGSEDVLSQIENIVAKYFHHSTIKFNSFALASFTVIRDIHANGGDFLMVDIGGEVTDIVMTKKDVLRESVSFPMGRNFILRSLASMMDTSIDEAKSVLSLYKDGHANVEVKKKIEPMLHKIRNMWLDKFQSSLSNLSHDISIPSTIFMTVDDAYADYFTGLIQAEQFNQYSLTHSKFKIIPLDKEVLHGHMGFGDGVLRDPFLTIESIYINRFSAKI